MEYNKLIAEFMGSKHPTIEDMYRLPHEDVYWGEMQYDTSWDWLMPVIENITELCEEPQELDELKHALLCVDIKSVYFIVVEFIKDHNNGKD
jgi:hypothetical protein